MRPRLPLGGGGGWCCGGRTRPTFGVDAGRVVLAALGRGGWGCGGGRPPGAPSRGRGSGFVSFWPGAGRSAYRLYLRCSGGYFCRYPRSQVRRLTVGVTTTGGPTVVRALAPDLARGFMLLF